MQCNCTEGLHFSAFHCSSNQNLRYLLFLNLMFVIFISASIAPCTIRLNAANPVGVPSYTGSGDVGRIYSCVSNANCNHDVHVLSCYEARNRGFRQHPTGHSTVDISAIGQSSRPIVLVLVSYEPIEWTLNIPSQIVIDTVIVVSCSSFSLF